MTTFHDFDAWADAISGASLRLVCDAVETRQWTLGVVDLGGVVLQVASEGGGNLCFGANTHPGMILFMPLTHAGEHVVNGEPIDDDSLLAIPCGADFRIRVRKRAHGWCSIALPRDGSEFFHESSGSRRVECRTGAVPRLRHVVNAIAASLLDRPAGTAAHTAAGHDLAAAAAGCLQTVSAPRARTGRPRLDRSEIVRRAMAAIDASVTVPTAAALARDVGVADRTLLRTFQETFGLPPKQYLMLRELHAVRRKLRTGCPLDATVADVLTRHGIWEFGRFAARYRRQFGESPSDTLVRARA